jgi:hypothetical protein
MVSDNYWPNHFGPGPNINMPTDCGNTMLRGSYSDLLEYQTIHANLGIGMNDHPVGMRQEQPTAER